MHSSQTEIRRAGVDCRSAKYYNGYCCWIFSFNILYYVCQMFSAKAQQLVRGLVVVASTWPRWSVAKGLAGFRCVVVGLLVESQWVLIKLESKFQRKVLVISVWNVIRIFFNAGQISISGSAGVKQCVAGISVGSRKILTGFHWIFVEFNWILGISFAVCRCRGSNMMSYGAAYWWESVLDCVGTVGYCGWVVGTV